MAKKMNAYRIPYGEQNFENLRREGFYYVDKTMFIEKLEFQTKVIHLRPRRFGKSLFVTTLEDYYDFKKADVFDEVFEGLYIHQHPTESKNNYYVMHFDFSGIATVDVETMMAGFRTSIEAELNRFLAYYELRDYVSFERTDSPADMLRKVLSEINQREAAHPVCILIDEYDHFTNGVLESGLTDFVNLIKRGGAVRSFYEVIKSFHKDGVVTRFFMTGVMSVSLDSITSGFNIASNLTTLEDFNEIMGFTAEEVKQLLATPLLNTQNQVIELNAQEQEEIFDLFKQNYNGYLFAQRSTKKIFNSTMIMYYLQHYIMHRRHLDSLMDSNMNQSGATIKTLADLKNRETNYEIVRQIIESGKVRGRLSTLIDVTKDYSGDDFITILFHIGLLTMKESGMRAVFEIPNKVIERVYMNFLRDMLETGEQYKVDNRRQAEAIEKMGETGDLSGINTLVQDFFAHLSGRNAVKFDEKYIKLIYLMILSSTEQYFVYDEFPALRGYTDIVILKSPASYAKYEFIIELKYLKVSDGTTYNIHRQMEDGKKQIATYLQDTRLQGRPFLERYVIVFVGSEIKALEEV